MDGRIRLGLAGFGRRGRGLLDLAVRLFDVDCVAVCDSDASNLEAARLAYPKAHVAADFDAMLDAARPDALLVETPATCHADFCCRALARNIHVMSDVPAVVSNAEAAELWRAQRASRAFYMLGANPNMWGFVDAAAELVEQGKLGEPYYMEAEYIHDLRSLFDSTPWRKTYESIRYCTHSLGPLLRLIKEDFEWVSCHDTGSHINHQAGQHDAMSALFRTRSNVVVRLLTSFINNHPGSGHAYRVFGTKGYFERSPACEGGGPARTLFYSTECHKEKALHEIHEGETPRGSFADADGGHGGADQELLRRFFSAVRTGGPSPVSLREGLRMTMPGIAALESSRQGGQLVRIEYPWADDRPDEDSFARRANKV